VLDDNNRLSNPPSGCIIDRHLVEKPNLTTGEFDFFLVPVKGTQGCMRPTHFYVS
jgi:aubergine-like protein